MAASSSPADLCFVTVPSRLRALAVLLRNLSTYSASTLIDIVVLDKIDARGRFAVKYLFLSTHNSQRFSILFHVDEVTAVPSLAAPFFNNLKIFASAG
jgi:NADH:ubiquinone oxidoreductase subunit C